MPVNEIEIPGTSISFRVLQFKCISSHHLFVGINTEGDKFSVDPEVAGFHDCDRNDEIVRGYFSCIVPFEVECLTDGIMTKTLLKCIETCEFIALENILFVTGKTGPKKILEHVLAGLTGYGVTDLEFEFRHMSQFQERLSSMKSIGLTNPKDREIRRVRMSGKMETYEEYNVIDPKNHGIESVSGLIGSPLGPLTVTVGRKGVIRLTVKRGFILTVECLTWILALVREEKAPGKDYQKHTDAINSIVRKMDSDLKKSGTTMTFEHNGKTASIGAKSFKDQVEDVIKEAGIPYQKNVMIKT